MGGTDQPYLPSEMATRALVPCSLSHRWVWEQAPTSDRLHEWGHGGAPIGPCYVCGAPASDSLIHLATSCLGGKCRSIRGDTRLRLAQALGGNKEAAGVLEQLGLRLQEGQLRGGDGATATAHCFATLHWTRQMYEMLKEVSLPPNEDGSERLVPVTLTKMGKIFQKFMWQPLWNERRSRAGDAAKRLLEPPDLREEERRRRLRQLEAGVGPAGGQMG